MPYTSDQVTEEQVSAFIYAVLITSISDSEKAHTHYKYLLFVRNGWHIEDVEQWVRDFASKLRYRIKPDVHLEQFVS